MREIKFRGWDGKEMHYTSSKNVEFTLARYGWSFDDIHSEDGVELCNDENGKLMQYTGLKDKKQKEIYEGDIVKAVSNGPKKIFIVEFLNNGTYSNSCAEFVPINHPWCNLSLTEVLGNKYENPELLKSDGL